MVYVIDFIPGPKYTYLKLQYYLPILFIIKGNRGSKGIEEKKLLKVIINHETSNLELCFHVTLCQIFSAVIFSLMNDNDKSMTKRQRFSTNFN